MGRLAALDFIDRADGQELTALDDADLIAHFGQLGEDVRADEDRFAVGGQLANHLAQLDACPRIEAVGRLIENQHAGIVDHRPAQAEPLPHAFREAADRLGRQLVEPRKAHRVLDGLMALAAGQAVRAGEEVEILVAIDVGIGAEIVGHEAEAAADAIGIVDAREAIDERVASGRQIERRQNSHAGRLARAVGADVAEHLAAADLERHVLHGTRRAEEAKQPLQFDDRMIGWCDHVVQYSVSPADHVKTGLFADTADAGDDERRAVRRWRCRCQGRAGARLEAWRGRSWFRAGSSSSADRRALESLVPKRSGACRARRRCCRSARSDSGREGNAGSTAEVSFCQNHLGALSDRSWQALPLSRLRIDLPSK